MLLYLPLIPKRPSLNHQGPGTNMAIIQMGDETVLKEDLRRESLLSFPVLEQEILLSFSLPTLNLSSILYNVTLQ